MIRRWPFLVPFICMAAGMTLSVCSGISCDFRSVLAVFICLLLACGLPNTRIFPVCAALFFFVWGFYALTPWVTPEIFPYSVSTKSSETPVTIEGIIANRPSVSPEGSHLTVRVERLVTNRKESERISGVVLLTIGTGDVSLQRGDRIRFVSRISVPRRLGLPGEFDYSRYLALQGISATCRVASQNDVVLIRADAVESWQRSIDQAAQLLGATIRRSISDERVSSVLSALLIGDQRRIPHDLADAYTRAGVNHILSISGFHIGIIAVFITMLVMWFLTRCEYLTLRWNVRRIAVLIAVPVMLWYLLLTGSAPATARSVIMLTIFAAALFVERERNSINTLLLSAYILVAINPPTLFDVSFQLSFLSLWGILVAVPVISKQTAGVTSSVLRSMIQFVAASIVASFVTLLPVLFIFNVASFNGILTNFLIVPLLGYGAVLTGFIALPFVAIFPGYSYVLLWPAASLVAIANHVIMWCTTLPVVTFHGVTSLDMFFFLLFMACVTFIRSKMIVAVAVILIPVCACVLHVYRSSVTDGRLHITMLSVGQAESILVQLPDGSNLLVDGGGYLHDTGHDFGQRVLAPALGALHVRRIDRMIATHNHPDHSGGFPFVIKNFEVGEFWHCSDVAAEVAAELNKTKVPQRMLVAGDVITLPGPVVLTVLSPDKSMQSGTDADETSVNEQSLVFRLSYGAFSMLFSADAGFEAERRILARRNELQATVLKVGHHGSRYSTSDEFLGRVHPRLAVISAGAGNRFGLPSTRTVDLLKANRIPLYCTDRDGTIELVTNGVSWSVSTPYKPE